MKLLEALGDSPVPQSVEIAIGFSDHAVVYQFSPEALAEFKTMLRTFKPSDEPSEEEDQLTEWLDGHTTGAERYSSFRDAVRATRKGHAVDLISAKSLAAFSQSA